MKQLILFPFFYLKEVIVGTLMVARDVIAPHQKLAPILLHVPIDPLTPKQRLLLASLISMTPGTISIDERDEGRTLIVHSLYGANNPESTIEHLKTHYESFVKKMPI
ncbi:Na+/H+ antiporter subunit E [Sulfuriroseicoccus oceanibius]|uniref:Na+/H+ antiporter subunit E n=1 Tax=Sulfuriroseicoccus oceanibius TaxID=2707525 RepID=A0A6B3L6V2_9BACT|nr:Na+/H+ antiporter subunit E [Sulfuriroseicoccus oceanibius]QQL45571.1 Na+/H+ antiporter subunit E [Sulfuriroseicoccus oceanibius]